MKNLFKTVILFVLLLCLTVHSFAQTATINGASPAILSASGNTISLSDNGYSDNAYISSSGSVELIISNALPTCTATVVAYRTNGIFSILTSNTSIYGTNNVAPWSTPSAANPSGVNYVTTPDPFFKAQALYPTATLAYGAGVVNPNGTYGVRLGGAPANGIYDGYYALIVTFNNFGVLTTQTFYFIVQPTSSVAALIESPSLSTTGTSCSSRPTTSATYLYEPHLGLASTITAQLYKNGVANGSAATYSDPGGYAGGMQGPFSFTLPAITTNGNYYVRYSQTFAATAQSSGPTYPFGSVVYGLPRIANFNEADMTGTTPISYTLSGGNPISPFAPNTSGTYYSICQYGVYDPITPANNIIAPLTVTVAGTNNTTGINSTATLTRYTTSSFGTLYTPSFAPTVFNSSGGVDGVYDLTALSSNYLKTAANAGYYNLHITTAANSCGASGGTYDYYFYWSGPPVGTLGIGKIVNGVFTSYGTLGATSGAGSVCSNPITSCFRYYNVAIGNASGNTGTFQGLKMKMERLSGGTCASPVWTTIFDGTGSGYVPSNLGGAISSWSNLNIHLTDYTNDVDINYGTTFDNDFSTSWALGGTYRYTLLVYNTSCAAAPTSFVTYISKAGSLATLSCKDDPTGDVPLSASPFNVISFPNPVQQQVGLTIQGPVSSSITIRFFNLMGQQIYDKVVTKNFTDDESYHVNVNYLAPGTYLYQVVNNETNEQAKGNFVKIK